MNENKISVLILTGLLTVLGTVAGGVVKGYWDSSLAQAEFQSELILRSLEPDDVEQRVTSLEFLIKANLITDPAVRSGVMGVINEGHEGVPQFVAVGTSTTLGSSGVQSAPSARERVIEKFPTLQGKNIALVGFRVRSGDIIDALTPIYAEVSERMELSGEYEGDRVGGTGGGENVLKQPGYVVTGFDVQRGQYFGRSEVVHFQVYWNRMTSDGIDSSDTLASDKLGGGNYAQLSNPPKEYRANQDSFISDFAATTSYHTSGETFLNDIQISETVVVRN